MHEFLSDFDSFHARMEACMYILLIHLFVVLPKRWMLVLIWAIFLNSKHILIDEWKYIAMTESHSQLVELQVILVLQIIQNLFWSNFKP